MRTRMLECSNANARTRMLERKCERSNADANARTQTQTLERGRSIHHLAVRRGYLLPQVQTAILIQHVWVTEICALEPAQWNLKILLIECLMMSQKQSILAHKLVLGSLKKKTILKHYAMRIFLHSISTHPMSRLSPSPCIYYSEDSFYIRNWYIYRIDPLPIEQHPPSVNVFVVNVFVVNIDTIKLSTRLNANSHIEGWTLTL